MVQYLAVSEEEKNTWDSQSSLTISQVKADTDIADSLTEKHSNSLDHAPGSDNQTLAGLGGIAHSLAIVANDFLVASGVGVFVKKTLVEVLTIIGKGAASGLASLDANSKLVQLRARADDGLLHTVLSNDTLAQNYAVNGSTQLTVTAARTLTTTVPPAGCTATTKILTTGTTSYIITFGTGFKPTATLATGTVAARVFLVHWWSDGTNLYERGRTVAMVA